MLIDIGKAHLYVPVEGDIYINLPPERSKEGKCAKLKPGVSVVVTFLNA